MARSDLIVNLVKAGSKGDKTLFKKTVEAMIAEERQKQHHVLASRLEENLQINGSHSYAPKALENGLSTLLSEVRPQKELSELILPKNVVAPINELIEEHNRADLLRSYSLEPRNKVLLVGEPGNGKTSVAEAIASALMLPFYVVRYESLIGSYLGETANRLHKIFEYIKTQHCVLFFDEFDTIGKERGDSHETGEIKRVVSSLLMQIDSLPSYVVIITASNHPELLDRAAWRRFQLRLEFPKPAKSDIQEYLSRFEGRFGKSLGVPLTTVAQKLEGNSFGEIEEFAIDIYRRWVLSQPNENIKAITSSRLKQLESRYSLK